MSVDLTEVLSKLDKLYSPIWLNILYNSIGAFIVGTVSVLTIIFSNRHNRKENDKIREHELLKLKENYLNDEAVRRNSHFKEKLDMILENISDYSLLLCDLGHSFHNLVIRMKIDERKTYYNKNRNMHELFMKEIRTLKTSLNTNLVFLGLNKSLEIFIKINSTEMKLTNDYTSLSLEMLIEKCDENFKLRQSSLFRKIEVNIDNLIHSISCECKNKKII